MRWCSCAAWFHEKCISETEEFVPGIWACFSSRRMPSQVAELSEKVVSLIDMVNALTRALAIVSANNKLDKQCQIYCQLHRCIEFLSEKQKPRGHWAYFIPGCRFASALSRPECRIREQQPVVSPTRWQSKWWVFCCQTIAARQCASYASCNKSPSGKEESAHSDHRRLSRVQQQPPMNTQDGYRYADLTGVNLDDPF